MICGRCRKDYSTLLVDLSIANKYFCESCIKDLTVSKEYDKILTEEVKTDERTRREDRDRSAVMD